MDLDEFRKFRKNQLLFVIAMYRWLQMASEQYRRFWECIICIQKDSEKFQKNGQQPHTSDLQADNSRYVQISMDHPRNLQKSPEISRAVFHWGSTPNIKGIILYSKLKGE